MVLAHSKILEKFRDKRIDKKSALEQLLALIENSSSFKIRLKCIQIISQIWKMNEKTASLSENIFKVFENLLISDSNESIRNAAALFLSSNFNDKAYKPMKWALHNDYSQLVLETILNSLINFLLVLKKQDSKLVKPFLLQELQNIVDKDFKIKIQRYLQESSQKDTISDYITILMNYFSLTYFKKVIWRLKYEIEDCRVTQLDFIFKNLTSFPEAIKNLTSLKKLIFRYNQLTHLPHWIGILNDLEHLNLNVNNINHLPDSFGDLGSLKELYLWKNELSNLPESFSNLSELAILNLRLNNITSLPESFGKLKKLKELNLHDNKLLTIPVSISNLKSLEILNLSWNELRELPDSIGCLPLLKDFDLERNKLCELPDSMSNLTSLTSLNLKDNKLKTIPDTFRFLKNLRYLNLSQNELQFLPISITSLNNLDELYIGGNKFTKTPECFEILENNGVKIFH